MNFLAPLFLAGAAAIAGPILFHLIRRSTRERVPFSSLFLLRASPPRMRRRSRLEDILLLILRALAVILLALGFGRPFFRNPTAATPAAQPTQRVVLLVDTSASMRRAGLWEATLTAADRFARSLAAGDHLALMTFNRESRTLISFEAWHETPSDRRPALVSSRLREHGPGWANTLLGQALIAAAESLGERTDDPPSLVRRVVLLSDLQEGANLSALQAYEWPKSIAVQVLPLPPSKSKGNVGLQLLTDATGSSPMSTNAAVRLRLTAAPDTATDRLELGWAGTNAADTTFLTPPVEVRMVPGSQHVESLPLPQQISAERIVLRGDAEDFDNTVHLIPPAPLKSGLLFVGDESPTDPKLPLYFLRRAFPPTNRLGLTLSVRRPTDPLADDDLLAGLAIATGPLPPETVRRLRAFALQGGTVLFAPRQASPETASTLATLLGVESLSLTEATVSSYAMLGEINLRHPLLAAFANPRFSDFTKIHFWHHRRLDTNLLDRAQVVARFDSGDAAWAEFPVERGRVFWMASGWHPEDSQLALSTKFVPLLFGLLELGGNIAGLTPRAYTVGEDIPLPQPVPAATVVHRPDGTTQPLPDGSRRLDAPDQPGVYSVVAPSQTWRFAVNLDPAESRTHPMAAEDLEKLGVTLNEPNPNLRPTAERTAELAATEVEGRQKLWRWFLVATLATLFLESTLAGWITRRVHAASDASTASV